MQNNAFFAFLDLQRQQKDVPPNPRVTPHNMTFLVGPFHARHLSFSLARRSSTSAGPFARFLFPAGLAVCFRTPSRSVVKQPGGVAVKISNATNPIVQST